MLPLSRFVGPALTAVLCGVSAWTVVMAAPSAGTQAAAQVPARDAQRKNPIPNDAGSRATGKQIYAGNCAPCHGAAGKGDGTVAHLQDLPPADLTSAKYAAESDGTLYWQISNGHRPMPHFANNLPDESRWNVVNYLRTFSGAPSTAPSTQPASQR